MMDENLEKRIAEDTKIRDDNNIRKLEVYGDGIRYSVHHKVYNMGGTIESTYATQYLDMKDAIDVYNLWRDNL